MPIPTSDITWPERAGLKSPIAQEIMPTIASDLPRPSSSRPAIKRGIGDRRRGPAAAPREADDPGGDVDEEAARHAFFAADAVGARAGAGAGEDGGEEGDADREPAIGVAEMQAVDDMDRHGGQRHRDREIRQKQRARQRHDMTVGAFGNRGSRSSLRTP